MKLAVGMAIFAGCGAAAVAAGEANVASYAAEQQACVADASTASSAQLCLKDLLARYCAPGGARRAAGACPGDGGPDGDR